MENLPHWYWQIESFTARISSEINEEASDNFWKYDVWTQHIAPDQDSKFGPLFNEYICFFKHYLQC